ncbi:hypothetical protein [Candidatus Methanarcanum hacksteinii]|uniref:hypothetical protein n=1 Tax=Candidatus Methanarcanum hacksteinii TaxID=2911857 RepID=UPI0037DC10E1
MKTKMKSAFAFIAVALMIMVAVVPMVGVFTEDSSATTTVDPATDKNNIKLKVNVADTSFSGKVKIAYGSYVFYGDLSSKGPEFSIKEASVDSLTISCVDKDGVEIKGYSAVTLTNLVAGKSYAATLKAGYISKTVEFKFANSTSTPISTCFAADSVIEAYYEVYDKATEGKMISEGQFTFDSSYIGTFLVPAGTSGDVFVTVKSFNSPISGLEFDEKQKITSSSAVIKAKQTLVTINPDNKVSSTVEIRELKATYGESGVVTFSSVKNTMIYTTKAEPAYFIGTLPTLSAGGVLKYTANLFADNSEATVELTGAGPIFTYSPTNAFFGTVAMGVYSQSGELKAVIKDSTTSTAKEGEVIATVNADGKFFKFFKIEEATGSMTFKEISFTSKNVEFTPTISGGYVGNASLTFVVPSTGYKEVKGALTVDGTGDKVADKELKVDGTDVKTFGSLLTDKDGKFAFMAEEGKNIILSVDNLKLYGGISVVPGSSSANIAISMESQVLTLKVADALGNPIKDANVMLNISKTVTQTFQYIDADKVYKATIRGDLAPADYTVSITKAGYKFAETSAFVEGSTYKANEADYTVKFFNDKGEIADITSSMYEIYKATAYKNTLNSIVYTLGEKVSDLSGKYKIAASFLGVKESDIGTEPVDVLVLKAVGLDTKGVFKDYYYLLDADDKGVISIMASVDSFTGKLVRNDGVTPVSGIEVKLNNGSADVDGATTFTQKDGSFTLYSDSTITSSYKVKFVAADSGYTFDEKYDTFKGEVRNSIFEAKTSAYTITFVDADDAKIKLTGTPKVGGIGVTIVTGNVAKLTAGWTSETDALAITDVTGRSFIDHTLTAEELASGEITVKSNQKTYTYSVKDANDKALAGTTIRYYKYVGEIPVLIESGVVTNTIEQTFLLPVVDDEIDTAYGYVAANGNYKFETAVTKITDVKIDIKSTSAMKTVALQDAAGVALTKSAGTVKIYEDGKEYLSSVTITSGLFKYVATKDVVYTYNEFSLGTESPYKFAKDVKDVNGVVKAKQETITGKVTDAAGKYFDIDATVSAYDANDTPIPSATGTQKKGNTSFSIIAEKSKIAYYVVDPVTVPSASVKFTFEKSKTADVKAVETFVPITFASANGNNVTIEPTGYTVNVINKLGIQTAMTNVKVNGVDGIVLDTTNVVSYSITFGTSVAGFKGTYTSTNGAFVSEYADYEGKLGATYATGDVLEYAVYKGNELVLRDNIEVDVDKTVYSAKVNKALGDKVIITFKKVVSGEVTDIYTAVMNDNVVYNDLVKVVVAPSLKANIMVNNDYVGYELSADKTKVYLIANESYSVDATSSTGDVLVEKFVFDGWYVNGEKVSSKLNYTVDNVDSNIIMANYVSDGYYEVDKPVQNDNGVSPTVLAIGIAAVIVALIAVVYTVIQKKE